MKRFIKIFALGILISGTFAACNKNEVKSKQGSCCHKKDSGEKGTSTMMSMDQKNSVYQLTETWTDANNQKIELSQLKDKVQLVAMVFTHCGYACPRMVDNIKNIEKQLPDDLKNQVGVVLVSFDVERDSPQRLKEYKAEKQLDNNWILLHGDADQVRTLSMLLNVQYNQLSDGSFNHSNVLTILDKNGNIARQIEGLDINSKNVADAIKDIVKI